MFNFFSLPGGVRTVPPPPGRRKKETLYDQRRRQRLYEGEIKWDPSRDIRGRKIKNGTDSAGPG